MRIGYTLHMPFWSRVKVLLGFGVRIEVDAETIHDITVFVPGEERSLKTILSLSLGEKS